MTTRPARPQPPRHLSTEGRKIWRSVTDGYDLEERHRVILTAAMEALDRMREAQRALETDGAYTEGRFGMKAHPAVAVERDSRLAMMRALRELGLDLDDPAQPRPPSRWRS